MTSPSAPTLGVPTSPTQAQAREEACSISSRVFHQTCTRRQNHFLSVRIAHYSVRKSSSLESFLNRVSFFWGYFEQTSIWRWRMRQTRNLDDLRSSSLILAEGFLSDLQFHCWILSCLLNHLLWLLSLHLGSLDVPRRCAWSQRLWLSSFDLCWASQNNIFALSICANSRNSLASQAGGGLDCKVYYMRNLKRKGSCKQSGVCVC